MNFWVKMLMHNNSRFSPQTRSKPSRPESIRELRKQSPQELLRVSFKDVDITQGQGRQEGQTFEEWQEQGLLADFAEYLRNLCAKTRTEAEQQGLFTSYGGFPEHSEFTKPKHIATEVEWAVLKHIGGQKARVAGHVIGSTFYIVFLDKDHQFYPTPKKNT
jgi:hypothetical protein